MAGGLENHMRSRPVTRTLAGFDKWRGGFDLVRQSGRAIARSLKYPLTAVRYFNIR
jgi:hypothetical protein